MENGTIRFKKAFTKINSPEQNIKYPVTESGNQSGMHEKWLFFESSTNKKSKKQKTIIKKSYLFNILCKRVAAARIADLHQLHVHVSCA